MEGTAAVFHTSVDQVSGGLLDAGFWDGKCAAWDVQGKAWFGSWKEGAKQRRESK